MAKKGTKAAESKEVSVEDRLKALYELQLVDSEVDKVRTLHGELPLEVQDLEDELEGLDTRIKNFEEEIKNVEKAIKAKKADIEVSAGLIKKYKEQQDNVRNNREFDSLSKEIEFQTLEIELSEKHIKEFTQSIKNKTELLNTANEKFSDRSEDLKGKKDELNNIIKDTEKEQGALEKKSTKLVKAIDDRLLTAYKRIRTNAVNGLAVVTVSRDACGGCFNKIPPQRQLDVKSRKKVIVCEYCGRILVDDELLQTEVAE